MLPRRTLRRLLPRRHLAGWRLLSCGWLPLRPSLTWLSDGTRQRCAAAALLFQLGDDGITRLAALERSCEAGIGDRIDALGGNFRKVADELAAPLCPAGTATRILAGDRFAKNLGAAG